MMFARALGLGLGLGLLLAAGCKPDPFRPDAGPPDTKPPPPPWWTPEPGEAADWDIQLAEMAAAFDVSKPRAMYAIDLWDAVPAPRTLDYGDGTPLMIPMGAHASAIATIHGQTPRGIVVCHLTTGALRLSDPDAPKFPGYRADPAEVPDRPTLPEAGSVIGWTVTDGEADERFLDLRAASREKVRPLIAKRLELADAIGCDAVAVHRNELKAYEEGGASAPGHGFMTLELDDYISWLGDLARAAHALELSVGLRASEAYSFDNGAGLFDWMITDRCAEESLAGLAGCGAARPFLNQQKAVFAIEYDQDVLGGTNDPALLCPKLRDGMIEDGIFKTAALDKTEPGRCPP